MKKYHHVTVGSGTGEKIRTIPFGRHIKARIAYPQNSKPGKKRAKRGKGKGHIISLLFSPEKFTLAEAKTWAKKHGYSVKGTAKAGTTTKRKVKRKPAKRKITKRKRSIKRFARV